MTEQLNRRIASIDILRGLVMVIMALDHVRDFFHNGVALGDPLDLRTTTPLLFMTRWITHYCAPTFVFLSGLSAGLSARKRSRQETAGFLIKRGFWLIAIEILVITLGLTFNPIYSILILQVIWAIGCSMVIMGLCLYVSDKLIFVLGLIIVLGHNLLNLPFAAGVANNFWIKVFITSNGFVQPISSSHFIGFFYAILPWTGVMMLGYSASNWYISLTQERRKRLLLLSGLSLILVFIILRWVNTYGDPQHWSVQKNALYTFLSFINVTKYPPSLMYVCMTIGPSLIFLSLTENLRNKLGQIFTVYGKVPFFYYVLHFYLIHTLLVVFFFASGYGTKDIITPNNPFLFRPENFGYSLPGVYLVWLSVVVALYFPCRWFVGYKQRHRDKWWIHYV